MSRRGRQERPGRHVSSSGGSGLLSAALKLWRRHRVFWSAVTVTVLGTVIGGVILALIGLGGGGGPQVVGPSSPVGPEIPTAGAFPFQVIDVGQLGLFIRTCPEESCGCTGANCEKLSAAPEDAILWAECQADTGFIPKGDPPGPWYRIRWSRGVGGTRKVGIATSSPHERYRGWAYSRYLEPVDPGTSLPTCT
jgi:hypothetical protein